MRTFADALPGFLRYLAVERRHSPATIEQYRRNIECFVREVGNLPIADVTKEHFIALKARMGDRGVREARLASLICAAKSLVAYARDILGIPVLDLASIKPPRVPRREVVYLTEEELDRFLEAIPLRMGGGAFRLAGYRFRALCEVLVATGTRRSEALGLNRDAVDFQRRLAVIVGKGNKQRTVFFTDRCLRWLVRYLDLRRDKSDALFATQAGERLKPTAVQAAFKRMSRWAGLNKAVTPHILRHTTATLLLKKGCPIGHIKEILGHDRLETTCRYYLGVLNQAEAQKAHATYMNLTEAADTAEGKIAEPAVRTAPSLLNSAHGDRFGREDKARVYP